MRKVLVPLALLALTPVAQATQHFVCDCQTGFAAGCVAGSSGGSDTAASPKQLVSQLTLAVSDSVSFCLGGAWAANASITGPGGTSTSQTLPWTAPFLWNTYSSPNFSSVVAPKITFAGTGFDFNKVNYNEVTGLNIIGSDVGATKGIILTAAIGMYSHGNEISHFDLGLAPSDGDNSVRTQDFISIGDNVHHNIHIGFEGCADRTWIENGTFDSNGSSTTIDHNIYVAGLGTRCNGVIIRNNVLTNNLGYSGGTCRAVSLVSHGWVTNMLIDGNQITETGVNTTECYGMSFGGATGSTSPPAPPNNQDFTGLVVTNNRITQASMGTQGIQISGAPYAIVSNNAIEHTNGQTDAGYYCIVMDTTTPTVSRGDVLGHDARVVNNSCKITLQTSSPVLSATSCWVMGTTGSGGDVLSSNACTMVAGASSTLRVMQLQGRNRATSFTNISNNVGINLLGTTAWDEVNATPGAASESGSSITDPNWATFPAVNVGSILIDAANATYASRIAYGRYFPVNPRDIGADDFNKSVQAPLGIGYGRVK